jgi:hypothetical protein
MADSWSELTREEILEKDAFCNIIFQELLAGDSLETQRQKSRDNAVAAIACELDEIRKLLKPQREEEKPSFSKTFLKVRNLRKEREKPDEILAEEKQPKICTHCGRKYFEDEVQYHDARGKGLDYSCGLSPREGKDLAAMQRLVEFLERDEPDCITICKDKCGFFVQGVVDVFKTLPDAILNLKVEK